MFLNYEKIQVVVIYENERYYPWNGWTSGCLFPTDPERFCLGDGKGVGKVLEDVGVNCEGYDGEEWRWVDDSWRIEVEYEYGFDFHRLYPRKENKVYNTKSKTIDCVRRRMLTRRRIQLMMPLASAIEIDCKSPIMIKEEKDVKTIELLRKELDLMKMEIRLLSEQKHNSLLQKEIEISQLKSKLLQSEGKRNSMLLLAKTAMVPQNIWPENENNQNSINIQEQEDDEDKPEKSFTKRESLNMVCALDTQFAKEEISIDEYALSLSAVDEML